MLCCSCDVAHDRCNYFSFWAIFCPFTPQTTWKKKTSNKWKKGLDKSLLTQVYQKSWSYAVLFLKYGTWLMYFLFWAIFCLFTPPPPTPPNNPKNPNFKKMKKEPWRYRHLTQVYQKSWSNALLFLRYGARQTDGWLDRRTDRWMDGRMEKVT